MDLQRSKIELAKMILDIDNQNIIDQLTTWLKSQDQDFWSELTESEKESIQIGIMQLDQGEGIPLVDFIKKVS